MDHGPWWWVGPVFFFTGIGMTIKFPGHSMSVVFIVLAKPLSVSGHWHLV